MSAEWANRGLNMWTFEERTIPVVAGTASYTLPADTVDALQLSIRTGSGQSQTDTTIERISVSTWAQMPTKAVTGQPIQAFITRTPTPTVTLWPVPDKSYTLVYWRLRRMQDVGDPTNTADIPFRFLPAITAGLAYHIALKSPQYVQGDRVAALKQIYDEQFELAADEDREKASVFILPDVGYL